MLSTRGSNNFLFFYFYFYMGLCHVGMVLRVSLGKVQGGGYGDSCKFVMSPWGGCIKVPHLFAMTSGN